MADEVVADSKGKVDRDQVSREIIAGVGGVDNISQSWHCITRLRFMVKDNAKVDIAALKAIPTVLTAQFQSGQLQVVMGPDVEHQFASLKPMVGAAASGESEESAQEKPSGGNRSFHPKHLLSELVNTLSSIFNPILPAIVGGGLLKGLLVLFTALNWLAPDNGIYIVLNLVGDAPFYFLPILLAASSAKRFNVNLALALTLGFSLMYPTIIDGAAMIADGGPTGLSFLGLTLPFINYSGAVLPPILGVWLMSYIYRLFDKIVPGAVKIVFTPLLTFMIAIPLTLIAVAPLGNYIGEIMTVGARWLWENGGIFFGIAMGGLMPLLVMIGAHYAFFPSIFQNLADRGYDFFFLPFCFMQNMAQAGAGFAVALRAKNRQNRSLAISTAIPAVFGITEPIMFGVTIRLRRPFIAAMIGGAIGGAWISFTGVMCSQMTVPGIMSLPAYISNDIPGNFNNVLIGVGLSFAVSFLLTLVMGFKEDSEDAPEAFESEAAPASSGSVAAEATPVALAAQGAPAPSGKNWTTVASPIVGELIALSEVPDPVFAEGVLGDGVGVIPAEGQVIAPFDGEVATFTETSHAIVLRSNEGIEMLIHVGLDTVALGGQHFEALVNIGDKIHAGQPLLNFNIDAIKEAGYSTVTPVVVINPANYTVAPLAFEGAAPSPLTTSTPIIQLTSNVSVS